MAERAPGVAWQCVFGDPLRLAEAVCAVRFRGGSTAVCASEHVQSCGGGSIFCARRARRPSMSDPAAKPAEQLRTIWDGSDAPGAPRMVSLRSAPGPNGPRFDHLARPCTGDSLRTHAGCPADPIHVPVTPCPCRRDARFRRAHQYVVMRGRFDRGPGRRRRYRNLRQSHAFGATRPAHRRHAAGHIGKFAVLFASNSLASQGIGKYGAGPVASRRLALGRRLIRALR